MTSTKMFSPVITHSVIKSICLESKLVIAGLFKSYCLDIAFPYLLLHRLLTDIVHTCLETNLERRSNARKQGNGCK